ncbi:hypothetical protein PC118_g10850 [Phytophthora cactorum]|uniref:Uncharacterized protein n=1 Tax=Phytophthora cactorum TaxID=29920 RepID=A0A8T1G1N0_9STRA|nr:hypothetical protein PC118_g10850 [Phytophthora cactorum]
MHDLETWYQAKAAVTLKISETAEDSAAHRFADDTAARYQCSEPLRSRHSLKSSQDLPFEPRRSCRSLKSSRDQHLEPLKSEALVQLYALRTSRTHRCFFSRSQLLQHRALSRLRSLGLLRSSLNRWMIG